MSTNQPNSPSTGSGAKAVGCLIFLLLAALFAVKKYVIVAVVNIFLFGDKLLSFGEGSSPIAGWIILGLFVGLIYGAWVAYKKYNLKSQFVTIAVVAFILFIGLMAFINKPLQDIGNSSSSGPIIKDAFSLVEVNSSGYLKPRGVENFSHFNLVDSNDNTAWIGNANSSGQTIEFTFKPEIDHYKTCKCIGFKIKNGYGRWKGEWQRYNRVKSLTFSHNGSLVTTLYTSDSFIWETMNITPIIIKGGDKFTLSINAVYSTQANKKKKPTPEVAITELVPVIECED